VGAFDDDDVFVTKLDLHIVKRMKAPRSRIKKPLKPLTGEWFGCLLRTIWPSHQRSLAKGQVQQVNLMSASQQLITGAAILIVDYSRHCQISRYRLYIVNSIPLCLFTSFQAIVILARRAINSHLKKLWRLVWVTAIFTYVVSHNFIFYNDHFLVGDNFGLSMQCIEVSLG
jgi:hypothetical protein